MENQLAIIQAKVKAPKGQFNAFGKYKYRSAEDILESVKVVVNPLGFSITLSDEIVMIGERIYVKAVATLSNGKEVYTSTGYAREEESKKGMDGSQVTGASSSYARKYALNGLFALDDTKDSDATSTYVKEEKVQQKPTIITPAGFNLDTLKEDVLSCENEEELVLLYNTMDAHLKLNDAVKQLFTNRKLNLK